MSKGQQSALEEVSVNYYTGARDCDAQVDYGEGGEPIRCGNSASITILRHLTGVAEFYCKVHAKDTWLEMAQ